MIYQGKINNKAEHKKIETKYYLFSTVVLHFKNNIPQSNSTFHIVAYKNTYFTNVNKLLTN